MKPCFSYCASLQFVSTMTALLVWSLPQVALVLPCILLYLQLMRTHSTRPLFGGLNVTKEKVMPLLLISLCSK